tara:strand:- start:351 stop:575 length:225 start_codon:yes stop_codon:yes gene_type:complete
MLVLNDSPKKIIIELSLEFESLCSHEFCRAPTHNLESGCEHAAAKKNVSVIFPAPIIVTPTILLKIIKTELKKT